jgi:UDP-glucose 4-epimerase
LKTLITGGAGFIGSNLAEELLRAGQEVAVVDDLSTGSLKNVERIRQKKGFTFVRDNVRNASTMTTLIEQSDVVIHLAAAVGVNLTVDEPVRTIETNVHGTEVVLDIANKFGKKVLIASSSDVYGKSNAVPFREDDDSVLGSTRFSRWAYACSKAIDEFLGLAYFEQYGLEVIVIRFFNTIGPRQTGKYGMVVPRFINWALRDEPLLVYGTGQQSRCFSYVGDIVEGVVGLIDCSGAAGRVYNLGSTEEITIESLADKVIAMTGSKSKKRFISYEEAFNKPSDDMMRRVPCVERIKETTGWVPKTTLEEALQIIIDEFKKSM